MHFWKSTQKNQTSSVNIKQSCDRGFRKWAYVFYINVGGAFYKPTKRKNLWSHGQQESGGRLFPRGSETGCVLFWGVRYAGSSSHALRTGRYLNYRFYSLIWMSEFLCSVQTSTISTVKQRKIKFPSDLKLVLGGIRYKLLIFGSP